MKVAIIFFMMSTVLLVNTSAQSFTIHSNSLSGSRRAKSAKLSFIKAKITELSRTINVYQGTIVARPMTDALEARYPDTIWVVFVNEANRYASASYTSYEALRIDYNGFSWKIAEVGNLP